MAQKCTINCGRRLIIGLRANDLFWSSLMNVDMRTKTWCWILVFIWLLTLWTWSSKKNIKLEDAWGWERSNPFSRVDLGLVLSKNWQWIWMSLKRTRNDLKRNRDGIDNKQVKFKKCAKETHIAILHRPSQKRDLFERQIWC